MTMSFDCHFAKAERGTCVPKRSARADSCPRAAGFSESADLDEAAVGMEPTLLAERDLSWATLLTQSGRPFGTTYIY